MTLVTTKYASPEIANTVVDTPLTRDKYYFFFGTVSPWRLNYAIRNITQATQAVVRLSPGHGVVAGDTVTFSDVRGMVGINGMTGTVFSVSGDLATVNINTTSMAAYTAGGVLTASREHVEETEHLEDARRKIVGMKAVDGSNMCHVVKRVDWARDQIYEVYNPNLDMTDRSYYVYSNGRVYICLDNANVTSQYQPTSDKLEPVKYADGYMWQLVYTVDQEDMNRFGNEEWIPVRNTKATIDDTGGIATIMTDEIGTGYRHTDSVMIVGDGSGARARIHRFMGSGSIMSIEIMNPGKNYSWANAYVESPTGFGCVLKTIVSTGIGYGVSPVKILLARHVKFVFEIDGSEDGNLYVGDIRTIGMLRQHDGSITGTVVDTRSQLNVQNNGLSFPVGTRIQGLLSGTTAIVAGSTETEIKYVEELGSGFIKGEAVTDNILGSTVINSISRFNNTSLKSADIVFIDNFEEKYIRNEGQLDSFEVVISY